MYRQGRATAPIPIIKGKRGPFQNSNESVWGDQNQNAQKCLGPVCVSDILAPDRVPFGSGLPFLSRGCRGITVVRFPNQVIIYISYPKYKETLPKALRTQALTALTSYFGLVGFVQYAWQLDLVWQVRFGRFGQVGLHQ